MGALYSRKQDLTSPNSVVSRAGFAQTGSLTDTFTDVITKFGGEAFWEAGTNATINVKSGSSFITSSHPSEPWFDEYGDFREQLQLVAKDYAIIPEFRISEHISITSKAELSTSPTLTHSRSQAPRLAVHNKISTKTILTLISCESSRA